MRIWSRASAAPAVIATITDARASVLLVMLELLDRFETVFASARREAAVYGDFVTDSKTSR